MADEEVTKRQVTMASYGTVVDDEGNAHVIEERAVDYVRPDFLDAYLENARGKWQSVTVADEPNAGPGGYHGQTHVPAELNHPLAGQTFAATEPEEK